MLNNGFFKDTEESPWGVAFRDLFMCAFGLLLLIVVMLEVPKEDKKTQEIFEFIPGSVTIFISWPPELNTDIDLWVWNSLEPVPIGYSNRGGVTLDLLRDDKGHIDDSSGLNMELTSSRGIIEGNWTVNLHYYSAEVVFDSNKLISKLKYKKIPITVLINIYDSVNKSNKEIYNGIHFLETHSQEITVLNFEIDDKGKTIPGSQNSIFKALRNAPVEDFQ